MNFGTGGEGYLILDLRESLCVFRKEVRTGTGDQRSHYETSQDCSCPLGKFPPERRVDTRHIDRIP